MSIGDEYIPRLLYDGEKTISEAALLDGATVIVVLAEPGAGKTEMLKSLSGQINAEFSSASIFRHRSTIASVPALVIDALDELARIDQTAIDQIIVRARDTQASVVVFACRSSEWDKARTAFVKECFASEPRLVWLQPFSREEQKLLFERHLPGESFAAFHGEADRVGLVPLLGNPQFLKLFADAFVQGGRRFTTKRKIFVDAVERLASERETSPKQRGRPPISAIVAVAEDIFAKLLLSGATGISASQERDDLDFPYLYAMGAKDESSLAYTLDTRLFKPSNTPGQHEPVHRIVAEYCAAHYLAGRIDDTADPFSLRRCMAVVAPNGVVRDELRGLLGWMAALGSERIQEKCLSIDPYAVLANGDPSQLTPTAKRSLLAKLRQLSEIDPYFRRSDSWRRFSVAGFFSADMVDQLKGLLTDETAAVDLKCLLLEILQASDVVGQLTEEIRNLLLNPASAVTIRLRAQQLLINLSSYDHAADFAALVTLGDTNSLRIAIETASEIGIEAIGKERLLALLRQIAANDRHRRGRHDGPLIDLHSYHKRRLIDQLDLATTTWCLDELTPGLDCTCGATQPYRCECRLSISKVIGALLDRYFELEDSPRDPARIWEWTRPLVFRGHKSPDKSGAVRALSNDDVLRQAIQRLAFDHLTDLDEIRKARIDLSMSTGHAGLYFRLADYRAMLDHAFATGNAALWLGFYSSHNVYSQKKGPDEYRKLMRAQARQRPELLRLWSKYERETRLLRQKDRSYWPRSHRSWERREAEQKEVRLTFFQENRTQIEAGRHWGALRQIADYYLMQPEKMTEIVDSTETAESALRNCFPFLAEHVPTLSDLVANGRAITRVLHAACLAWYRKESNLAHIDLGILKAVKTDVGGYQGLQEGEAAAFEAEIDKLLFTNQADIVAFAREYIEPELSMTEDTPTQVGWLHYKEAFKPLQSTLALEWLKRFPDMPAFARETLFDICAQHADRRQLNELIVERCNALLPLIPSPPENQKADCDFWFLRAFFFLDEPPVEVREFLKADPQTIFRLDHRAGRSFRDESVGWPDLSAEKVYWILDTYVDVWPAVYLPSSYSTGDPPGETAYRFLTEVIYLIGRDAPNRSIPVLDAILADSRFNSFHNDARSMKATALRKEALQNFQTPTPREVVAFLEQNRIATVEDLRALMIEELDTLEAWLRGAETDPLDMFYSGGKHLDENSSRNRIVDRLQGRMAALNLPVTIEQHMAGSNRCDMTAMAMIEGHRQLLVIEVKGQWHPELFSAASTQLYNRYSSHPDAAKQGIYLVLWFGGTETIAGRKEPNIATPSQLRDAILVAMPKELQAKVDVFVLDLSLKTPVGKRPTAPIDIAATY